jgi:hypothetical protein
MIEKAKFKKMFGEVFAGAGFARKGQSWFLPGKDATVVVNLQKSDFAEKFYVNVGIWLMALGESEFPKENHCQIQVRLGSLFAEHVSLIDKACTLEFAEQSDIDELLTILRERLVPFCRLSLTLEGLRQNAEAKLFGGALIFKQARELLGIA